MNKEEIKEILEDVKRHLDYVEATKQCSIRDNEMKAMYNYITNLQERFNALLEAHKIADELETEYQNRINKAIEYIKENACYGIQENCCLDDLNYNECDELLEILKGEK